MTLLTTLAALEAKALNCEGLAVYRLGQSVVAPAVVFDLPDLSAATLCAGTITDAQWSCWLVVNLDEYAMETMLGYLESFLAVMEDGSCTVNSIVPGVYTGDAGQLPAYELTFDVALTEV